MGEKLLGGASGLCQVVGGLARHVLWYLSYQIDGASHSDPDEAPARSK